MANEEKNSRGKGGLRRLLEVAEDMTGVEFGGRDDSEDSYTAEQQAPPDSVDTEYSPEELAMLRPLDAAAGNAEFETGEVVVFEESTVPTVDQAAIEARAEQFLSESSGQTTEVAEYMDAMKRMKESIPDPRTRHQAALSLVTSDSFTANDLFTAILAQEEKIRVAYEEATASSERDINDTKQPIETQKIAVEGRLNELESTRAELEENIEAALAEIGTAQQQLDDMDMLGVENQQVLDAALEAALATVQQRSTLFQA